MKLFSMKRALSASLMAVAVASLLNCGGGREESFTSSGDAAVVSGVTGVWMGTAADGNTYVLNLCEDTSSRDTDVSCQTLHKVQGDGRGATETTQEPTGCGGCDYDYSVYVNGSIEGTDLEPSPIQGQFSLSGGDARGLAFPYMIHMQAPATAGMHGTMTAPDAFTIDGITYSSRVLGDDAGAGSQGDAAAAGSGSVYETQVVFHRSGDATCPAK